MASGAIAGPDDCDQEVTGRKSELFRVTINGKGIYSGDIIINTYSYPVLYISSLIYVFSHSLNIFELNQFFFRFNLHCITVEYLWDTPKLIKIVLKAGSPAPVPRGPSKWYLVSLGLVQGCFKMYWGLFRVRLRVGLRFLQGFLMVRYIEGWLSVGLGFI